jgi:hypothetical protein
MIENQPAPDTIVSPWRIIWWATGIPMLIEWFKP